MHRPAVSIFLVLASIASSIVKALPASPVLEVCHSTGASNENQHTFAWLANFFIVMPIKVMANMPISGNLLPCPTQFKNV